MKSAGRDDIRKEVSVKDMTRKFAGMGFTARRIGEAVDVYRRMIEDRNCLKIISSAGALVAGGLRGTFVEAINNGLVDALVFTGALLTHDLIEAFGVKHIQGDDNADDVKLAEKDINRIYDIFLDNEGYVRLEKELQALLGELPQELMSPSGFLNILGSKIKDEGSIIKAAYEKRVKIFCPSITDSILGFQLWMYGQDHKLQVNPQMDIKEFLDLVWQNKKFGMLILGGGVPKNFVNIMMQVSGKSLDYAIQVTMDRPEHGGSSGAPLREAKSWKKVSPKALTVDVCCDATVAFPLIIESLL